MKVVIVDSGVNKTHPIFKNTNTNTNICSMQYQDGYIINAALFSMSKAAIFLFNKGMHSLIRYSSC